jgi:hypothetical protein
MEYSTDSLLKFFEYLGSTKKIAQTVIIGYNILKPIDIERKLQLDISLDLYDSTALKTFIESTLPEQLPCYVFNIDFNLFCVLSKGIIGKFSNINKINKIIFDSSTFKFMSNIKLIALFYYLILEENGSIYIESNKPIFTCSVISSYAELMRLHKSNNDGFYYPSGYSVAKTAEHTFLSDKYKSIKNHILSPEQIYEGNVNFIQKWFYGSTVELLDNLDNSYPITNERYPITKYYKITKLLAHESILKFIGENAREYDDGLSARTSSIVRLGSI